MILKVRDPEIGGWMIIDEIQEARVADHYLHELYLRNGESGGPKTVAARMRGSVDEKWTESNIVHMYEHLLFPRNLFEDCSSRLYTHVTLHMRDGGTKNIGFCNLDAFLLNDKGSTIEKIGWSMENVEQTERSVR